MISAGVKDPKLCCTEYSTAIPDHCPNAWEKRRHDRPELLAALSCSVQTSISVRPRSCNCRCVRIATCMTWSGYYTEDCMFDEVCVARLAGVSNTSLPVQWARKLPHSPTATSAGAFEQWHWQESRVSTVYLQSAVPRIECPVALQLSSTSSQRPALHVYYRHLDESSLRSKEAMLDIVHT